MSKADMDVVDAFSVEISRHQRLKQDIGPQQCKCGYRPRSGERFASHISRQFLLQEPA